jgi:uncharacterized protein (TIGR03437 family)
LRCSLSINNDGTPTLIAGSVTPTVYLKPIGLAGLAVGVNPISVPLVATSLTTITGGNNGGYYNYLIGKGFPLDKTKISITICSNAATIISSSNEQVYFYTPSCLVNGSQAVNVTVGTLTDSSLTFTYTNGSNSAPTINSISPTTQNPAIKGLLQINGTGFGTNRTAINVFLSNSSGKVYQLNVLSVNDSNIEVGLSGGLAGIFTVQVTLPNTAGDSIASPGVDQF